MNQNNVSLRLSRRQIIALVGALLAAPPTRATSAFLMLAQPGGSGLPPRDLRCEYRTDPLGVDAVRPSLSWTMADSRRGVRQTAYHVRVASSPQALARGHGDLWDSGRVPTDQCSHVAYAGRTLISHVRCHWQVRLWDQAGHPTGWSEPAFWTIGLLRASDWQGQWISDAVLADPANRPRTPIHCYRSEIAHTPTAAKWVMLDLGASRAFDGACLQPAKPEGVNGDIATILYPVRFTIEAANAPDFHDAKTVVARTEGDVRPPRPSFSHPERYRFPQATARYIRLSVSRLARWDGDDYALALGRFQVFEGETEIAAGATATASDSVETDAWSRRFLTDPLARVAYGATPPVLAPHMGGVDSVSRVPLLRREFQVERGVQSATLYCTARGFYEARLNGARVSDDALAPGYTEYDRRIEYRAYDVTRLLRPGVNVLGALLGYGWYAGHMNLSDNEYIYGYFPQLLAQLEIEYTGGRRAVIGSDAAWKTTLEGPVRWSDLLDGEGYDCRREMPGWDRPRFDDAGWRGVAVIPRDDTPLVWQRAQPVRRMQELRPIGVREVAPGVAVFDLGQEISGWCRIQAEGPLGTRLTVRHAEQRHPDGSLNRDNLWGTAATEDYILDGRGRRALEPHFTSHGFRFVEVTGLTRPPAADAVVGVHVRTGARQVGRFHCSNALYNKLMDASRWTQQNLLFDVPAGCAGRAERLAWTGDIRPCVQTALFHFDSAAFFEKYAADLRYDQTREGRFTDVCPHAHLRDTDVCRLAGLGGCGRFPALGALPEHRRPAHLGGPLPSGAALGGFHPAPQPRLALDKRARHVVGRLAECRASYPAGHRLDGVLRPRRRPRGTDGVRIRARRGRGALRSFVPENPCSFRPPLRVARGSHRSRCRRVQRCYQLGAGAGPRTRLDPDCWERRLGRGPRAQRREASAPDYSEWGSRGDAGLPGRRGRPSDRPIA